MIERFLAPFSLGIGVTVTLTIDVVREREALLYSVGRRHDHEPRALRDLKKLGVDVASRILHLAFALVLDKSVRCRLTFSDGHRHRQQLRCGQ